MYLRDRSTVRAHSALRAVALPNVWQQASLVLFMIAALACAGCTPTQRVAREVGGRNADGETLNYYFRLRMWSHEEAGCSRITVRVYPKEKFYTGQGAPPPGRMKLVDEDCSRPLQFERVSYLRADGTTAWLARDQIPMLWMKYQRLEHEMHGWLFQQGF